MNFQRLIYLGNPWPNLLAQNSLPETRGGGGDFWVGMCRWDKNIYECKI